MESGFWPLREAQPRRRFLLPAALVLCGLAGLLLTVRPATPAAPLTAIEIDEGHFVSFIERFGKSYRDEEERTTRFSAFRVNMDHVRRYNAHNPSFRLGVTKFADLPSDEFERMYTSELQSKSKKHYTPLPTDNLPETQDWVSAGAVTPVENQGFCGSCWAFAAAGALSGAYFKDSGELVDFSKQQLIDCSQKFGTTGCDGGEMDDAYRYIIAAGGLETSAAYPYEEKDGKCRIGNSSSYGAISTYGDVPKGSELQLKAAVAQQPVAVGVQANEVVWQMYESGILDSDCGQRLNHGVLVVGYGSEEGVDYWLVKNTWGDDWGIEGYVKIKRDVSRTDGGLCGIALDASYPRF